MSGGRYDYKQCDLGNELFGYGIDIDYGEYGHSNSAKARKLNPLEDREISEIVFDVLCLIHSYDWYKSGDTLEKQYRDDVKWFKKKWMNRTPEDIAKAYVKDFDICYKELRKELEESTNFQERNLEEKHISTEEKVND